MSPFNKSFIFAVLLSTVLVGGCANNPYVRSDIFVDPHSVRNIYIMPVVTEVTVDSSFEISREKLQIDIREAKEKIKHTLKSELAKRGYAVGGYSKEFHKLDKNKHSDNLIRAGVEEFLHSKGSDLDGPAEALIEALLKEVFLKGDFTVTDQDGNKRKIKKEEMEKITESIDSLVARTLDAKEVFPENIDTVLYMEIKSFIAKRGLWKSLQEKSTVNIRLKLINISKKKIVFSYQTSHGRSDILHWRSFEKALTEALDKIPVKLED